MVQKVVLVDDLDGSAGDQTVTYTVDGQEYEIDLSEKNVRKFRDALTPFIEKSRPVERQIVVAPPARGTRRRGSTGGGEGKSGRSDLPQIRAWADSQGMQVSARGRIKKEIIDAYDEAHK